MSCPENPTILLEKVYSETLEDCWHKAEVYIFKEYVVKSTCFPKTSNGDTTFCMFESIIMLQKFCPHHKMVPVIDFKVKQLKNITYLIYIMPKLNKLNKEEKNNLLWKDYEWYSDFHRDNFMKNDKNEIIAIDLEGFFNF